MDQPKILSKLKAEFETEITSERQVVYILVEIGKLLEQAPEANFPTIKFYRDWVVHTKLDRSPFGDSLVRHFDEYVTHKDAVASNELKKLVSPSELRDELKSYLCQHGLDFKTCSDDVLWKKFVKYLAEVIDETPVHHKSQKQGKNTKTKHVESVTVSRRRNHNGTAMLTWRADCHSPPPEGAELEIEVVLLPGFDKVLIQE